MHHHIVLCLFSALDVLLLVQYVQFAFWKWKHGEGRKLIGCRSLCFTFGPHKYDLWCVCSCICDSFAAIIMLFHFNILLKHSFTFNIFCVVLTIHNIDALHGCRSFLLFMVVRPNQKYHNTQQNRSESTQYTLKLTLSLSNLQREIYSTDHVFPGIKVHLLNWLFLLQKKSNFPIIIIKLRKGLKWFQIVFELRQIFSNLLQWTLKNDSLARRVKEAFGTLEIVCRSHDTTESSFGC